MFALTSFRAGQPKTFSRQKELPRLPIPALSSSLERYVKTLRPLLLQEAAKSGKNESFVAEEISKREALVADFIKPGGLGSKLQQRLLDVDRTTPSNWLDDRWWIKVAYHSWRVPLPINSNWWILMASDSGIPADFDPPQGQYTDWQIKRAAKLTQRLVDFKLKLDSQEILPDSSRAGAFCMYQYTRVFGVTRVPQIPADDLVHAAHPHKSDFVIVIANDHFYKLPVIQEDKGVDLSVLEADLWAIADDAAAREKGAGVGAMSGDDRDTWTKSREHLLSISPDNRVAISLIEDSLFVVSLDAKTQKSANYKSSSPTTQTPDLDAHIFNASTSAGTGRNRWWDKGISIQIEPNGRGVMLGEHSPCDALIPSIVADYVLAEGTVPGPSQKGKSTTQPERIEFVVDEETRKNIKHAEETVAALAADSEGRMLWYDEYGSNWIKQNAKQSPDAYLQMALQLAYYKTHNESVATYETASTRLFLHGRTDVIRTFSEDSYRWVTAMKDGLDKPKELYELLTKATLAHNKFTKDSSLGKGFDRHLMGLKLLMRDGETHPLFEDPLFSESQAWVLSTSGLSAGDRFFGTGFGTVWPNGYGINYLAGANLLKFGIESKRSCAETSTEKFRANLVEALREMRQVCEKGQA